MARRDARGDCDRYGYDSFESVSASHVVKTGSLGVVRESKALS